MARRALVALAFAGAMGSCAARATPALTMDVATGEVLYQEDATQPWFPASTTKLMTVYVALAAVEAGKISMDTPLVYSARARSMPPSKMGFAPGTQVTLRNALRMLMVKSANDIAITVAEGVSGSVEAFAEDMNAAAAEIGLRESHFVNPNGLPNPDHYSSARDMALIARALYTRFPQAAPLFDIGELQLGSERILNHNNLLGRYPGADGMKTGFTCPAGFNVVASAFRNGRRVVAIVMGAPSVATRTAKVAALFDRAFANIDRPSGQALALPASTLRGPPDMRNEVCRNRGRLVAQFNAQVQQLDQPLMPTTGGLGLPMPEHDFLFSDGAAPGTLPTALRINSTPQEIFQPVDVHVGADPGYQGPVAEARAPHSPIGSEPMPPAVEAYAATPPEPAQGVGVSPLPIDPGALVLHGPRVRAAGRAHRGRARALSAAAEAPKTKVLAGAEGDEGTAAPPAKSTAGAHGRSSSHKRAAAKPKLEKKGKPVAHGAKATTKKAAGGT